jgi:hypothetical protein
VNQWLNPLKRETGSNLVDAGRGAVHAKPNGGRGDSDAGYASRLGGHTEGLRRRCGDAAGEELDADPADRYMVNVGTVPEPPSHRPSRAVTGRPAVG